jgi:hypothetical protein
MIKSFIIFDSKIFRHKNKSYQVLYLDIPNDINQKELSGLYHDIYAEFKHEFKTGFNHSIYIPYHNISFYYFNAKDIGWNILTSQLFKNKFSNGY